MSRFIDQAEPSDFYSIEHRIAADAAADARAAFIRKTYGHLAIAILAFAGLEAFLLNTVPAEAIQGLFAGRGAWLICMIAFMVVATVANRWASSGATPAVQYLGLGMYVVLEAVIFLPLLMVVERVAPGQGIIQKAGIITLSLFAGLSFVAFVTRTDFSFLRTILSIGSFLALGVIVASCFFGGINLGLGFSFFMVALACGFILYDTSNVLHHYRTDQYVAASLALFASIALLFWYVIRILLASSRD